jgi:hypothetical protein
MLAGLAATDVVVPTGGAVTVTVVDPEDAAKFPVDE